MKDSLKKPGELNERTREDYTFLTELSETLHNSIVKNDILNIGKIVQNLPLIEKRLHAIRTFLFSFLNNRKTSGLSTCEYVKELKHVKKKNSTNMLLIRKVLALIQKVMEKLDPGKSRIKKIYSRNGRPGALKTSVFLSRTA